jgi:hypothetical protein
MRLTVFYNGQFWVGVLELETSGQVKVARHIFGPSEPSDPEVYAFVMADGLTLLERVQTTVSADVPTRRRINPKRMAREAARELAKPGVSSKAQEALRLELEQRKQQRRTISRSEREAEKERKWELRRAKAKARHRGH